GTRAMVLLTDGVANFPPQGLGPGDPQTPQERYQHALAEVQAAGVTLYMVPTAHDSDHASSAQAAVQTGGALLSASRAAETIPAFVEVFARQRGEALAHHPRQRPTRA